jgi:hypothetical protein
MKLKVYLTARGVEDFKNYKKVQAYYRNEDGYWFEMFIDITKVDVEFYGPSHVSITRYEATTETK